MTNTDAIAEQFFLSNIVRRLSRRKLLIGGGTLVIFMIMLVGIDMLPRAYEGIATVVIEGQTPNAVQFQSGDVMHDMPFDDQTIGTEMVILKSRELLTAVVTKLNLLSKPEFNPNLKPPGVVGSAIQNLKASIEVWLPSMKTDMVVDPTDKAMSDTLDTLRKHIKPAPVARSRAIDIVVTANNNRLAADIANTIADLYIGNHREYKLSASKEAHEFLAAQIDQLRDDAAKKAEAVERYRIDHNLTTAMTATPLQEQISYLSQQLQLAQGSLAKAQGAMDAAKSGDPSQLPAVLASPTIQKLREQEATYAAQRSQLVATYGPSSQMLNRIDAQLAGVRGQIAAEAQRAVKSLPNDVASAKVNIENLGIQLTQLKAQAAIADESRSKLATLSDIATAARNVYTTFQDRLRQTDAAMAYGATNVRVVSHAVPSIHPSYPPVVLMVPAAFLVAFFGTCTLAYRSTRQKGMTGTRDITVNFEGITPLGMIPVRTPRTLHYFSESINELLNRLVVEPTEPPRSIMITSALNEEGKTTTSRALADAAMQRGYKVFVIDADMRSARALKPRTAAPVLGLSDVLRGEISLEDAVTRRSNVPMLPAGSSKGIPTVLMANPRLGRVFQELQKTYDLIIVDAPPAVVGGDCALLARVVDTTVMLIKWRSTDEDVVAMALNRLRNANVAGMVLTMVDPAHIGRYDATEAVIYSKRLHQYYHSS